MLFQSVLPATPCKPAKLVGDLLECYALITVQHSRQLHSAECRVARLRVVLRHAAAQHSLQHLQERLQRTPAAAAHDCKHGTYQRPLILCTIAGCSAHGISRNRSTLLHHRLDLSLCLQAQLVLQPLAQHAPANIIAWLCRSRFSCRACYEHHCVTLSAFPLCSMHFCCLARPCEVHNQQR